MAESRALPQAKRPRDTIVGEGAEGDDHPRGQQVQLAFEVGQAVVALLGRRLVARRGAVDDRGDVGVDQAQPVIAVLARRLVREAGAVECREQPIARAVAGEDAPRPVPAVRRRRQADYDQLRVRVAERRNRAAPVLPVAERSTLLSGKPFAPLDETLALAGGDDVGGDGFEGIRRDRASSPDISGF